MKECLTESNLGGYLNRIYGREWIHDKRFITLKRPDYRNDDLKLIVEFDGPKHFTSSERIVQDLERDKFYLENGYNTIRIPMYIQMSKDVVKNLFGIEMEIEQEYPHGFISDASTMVYPSDFCELGIEKFKYDLDFRFKYIKDDILDSLKDKISKRGDIRLVLPPSLFYLVK